MEGGEEGGGGVVGFDEVEGAVGLLLFLTEISFAGDDGRDGERKWGSEEGEEGEEGEGEREREESKWGRRGRRRRRGTGWDGTYNDSLGNSHQILGRLDHQPREPSDGPSSIVSAVDGFGGEAPGGFVAFVCEMSMSVPV